MKKKNVSDVQKFYIPEYNVVSLLNTITHIVNMRRRGLISSDDALDEIVRAYQDQSLGLTSKLSPTHTHTT